MIVTNFVSLNKAILIMLPYKNLNINKKNKIIINLWRTNIK